MTGSSMNGGKPSFGGRLRLRCRAVLFDLDGVLVDSMALVHRAWRWWAVSHGLDPGAVARAGRGGPAVETVRRAAPHLDAAREAQRISDYEADAAHEVIAFPGALALLETVGGGGGLGSWGIVTSGVRRVARGRIEVCRLPDPPVLVTADDVTKGKPDPQCYLQAATALGVDPGSCLVVEDGPGGVTAARAAGMGVVAVASTRTAGDLVDADAVVPALTSLSVSVAEAGFVVQTAAMPTG